MLSSGMSEKALLQTVLNKIGVTFGLLVVGFLKTAG